jgi:AAA domain
MVRRLVGDEYGSREARDAVYGPAPNQPSGEVDMLDECRRLLTRLETEGPDCLDQVERRRFIFSWNEAAKAVVARTKVVVTTLKNLFSDLLSTTIGKDTKGIVLLVDDACMDNKLAIWTAWIRTVKLDRIRNEFGGKLPIKAVVLVGIREQKRPFGTSEEHNEFHDQLAYAMLNRYDDSGFPSSNFTVQWRQQHGIAFLAKSRIHSGKITTDPSIAINRPLSGRQFRYFSIHYCDGKRAMSFPDYDGHGYTSAQLERRRYSVLRAWFFNVENSDCVKCQNGSRVNPANVQVIGDFIRKMWCNNDHEPFSKFERVVVLAPWPEQVQLLVREINNIARERGWKFESAYS